jgi:hypothetical protein
LWDDASRDALRDFKVLNQLPHNDVWDAVTEQKLGATQLVNAERTFVGAWWPSSECLSKRTEDVPLLINTRLAHNAAGTCEFLRVVADGGGWRIRAKCTVEDKTWNANIRMTIKNGQLVWSSEKGVATYYRCQ